MIFLFIVKHTACDLLAAWRPVALLATALPPPPAFNGVAFSESDKNCFLTTIKKIKLCRKEGIIAKSVIMRQIAGYQRGVGSWIAVRPMMKEVMGQ